MASPSRWLQGGKVELSSVGGSDDLPTRKMDSDTKGTRSRCGKNWTSSHEVVASAASIGNEELGRRRDRWQGGGSNRQARRWMVV